MAKPAVVLSSGGLDSTTVLALARAAGFDLYSISFDYGQRHRHELAAAERVAQAFDVKKHALVRFDLRQFGGSALTSDAIDVPKPEGEAREAIGSRIPVTYVPARNTIFLSFALAWAETLCSGDIFIGVNAMDYSGYPDCRPEYVQAFQKMADLATRAGTEGGMQLKIHTPLIRMSKAEIIRKGIELGVDYGLTHSCYDPSPEGLACGRCESCLLRLKGFQEAGIKDPVKYQE